MHKMKIPQGFTLIRLKLAHTKILRGNSYVFYIFAKKYLMNYDSFLRFIFPDGLFDYFEMVQFNELSNRVEIYFEEVNRVPAEYSNDKLESKGFYEEVRMHDYPMRGRCCILFIKKRRWYNHTQGKYVSRNWRLMAEGTQISSDFASFLKAMDRLSRH